MARAIYAQKDLVIFDDALSGLDAETENRVFHNLLGRQGLLRRHRTTVVIASSSGTSVKYSINSTYMLTRFVVQRLPFADHIIALSGDGLISEQGRFDDLSSAGGYTSSFNLPLADWNYYPVHDNFHPEKEQSANSVLSVASDKRTDDTARRSGDCSVYLYYAKAVGWVPSLVFVVAICAFIFCISFPGEYFSIWAYTLLTVVQQYG